MRDLIREESIVKRIRRVGLRKGEKLDFPAIKKRIGDYKHQVLIKETEKRSKKVKKIKPNKK